MPLDVMRQGGKIDKTYLSCMSHLNENTNPNMRMAGKMGRTKHDEYNDKKNETKKECFWI